MDKEDKLYVDIRTDTDVSLFDDIRSLQLPPKPKKIIEDDSEPVILMNKPRKSSEKKKTKSKKSKKSALLDISEDLDFGMSEYMDSEEDTRRIMDIEDIAAMRTIDDDDDDIVKAQKKGYKKLKDNKNEYKKEFAEEITLLYQLMDETTKFGKDLEKDLNSMRNTKVRGVSKYSNDLAELVLSSKQTKLNILKEIASVKKTIADLAQKSEKTKANAEAETNKNERLASNYFNKILSHGRTDFIRSLENDPGSGGAYAAELDNIYDNVDMEERSLQKTLEERLDGIVNPYRSEDGGKYIEYENRGVTIEVHKCVDTGEWNFVAVDKYGDIIDDYPLPTKRTAGRMKFSDDGTYCSDAAGRMYKIQEYYLPDDNDANY